MSTQMTSADARRYLVRLVAEYAGALGSALGLLLLTAGVTGLGVVLLLGGATLFGGAVLWANAAALAGRAPGQPWFGPGSVASEANRLTGWWYLEDAAVVLGVRERMVRGCLRASIAATVVAFVAVPMVAVARG